MPKPFTSYSWIQSTLQSLYKYHTAIAVHKLKVVLPQYEDKLSRYPSIDAHVSLVITISPSSFLKKNVLNWTYAFPTSPTSWKFHPPRSGHLNIRYRLSVTLCLIIQPSPASCYFLQFVLSTSFSNKNVLIVRSCLTRRLLAPASVHRGKKNYGT